MYNNREKHNIIIKYRVVMLVTNPDKIYRKQTVLVQN